MWSKTWKRLFTFTNTPLIRDTPQVIFFLPLFSILNSNYENPLAMFSLAYMFKNEGKIEEAILYYEKASNLMHPQGFLFFSFEFTFFN